MAPLHSWEIFLITHPYSNKDGESNDQPVVHVMVSAPAAEEPVRK